MARRLAKRAPTAALHLDIAFRRRPLAPLATAAITVAQAEGDPIGSHLAPALAAAEDPELARRLEPLLPETTTALREVKLEVTLQRHRAALAESSDDASEEQLSELARQLNNLSIRLGQVGRQEEGLSAIKESVEICRRLAWRRPEAFEPDLARGLATLANQSMKLDRADAAADSAEESLRRVVLHLERNPGGFAGLGRSLLSVYRRATAAASRPPDDALVERVEALSSR